jgi:dTDP-4-dehydrorhamnose reductase
MRIFITGSEGQLGKVLRASLAENRHEVAGGDLPDWDMMDGAQVAASLRVFGPDVVLHAAALTNVDYCAEHPQEAVRINGVGTYNVVAACREVGAQIVAISSNEVFDGAADRPYEEYDPRHPINPYGRSKAVAEQVVERFAPDYMIVRTAWLYAPGGTNFIHKILERTRSGGPLRVVTDEVGSPTYAVDLARALGRLIEIGKPGIYHLANAGVCSRHEFAQAIVEMAGLDTPVEPITSDAFDRPSTPPVYSPLANVFAAALGVEMRPWREAVAAYLDEYES